MKEHIKIDASVASHKGNIHSKNEEKFYLNGQYMDLNQQKDSTVKASNHSYKQSVYGIAAGTIRGALGEQAAFIAVEALSRYHLYLEENVPSSFAVKKQRLIEYLKTAEEKIRELWEEKDGEAFGATMVGLIIDGNQAFGFSLGEEGFYMVEKEAVRKVSLEYVKEQHFIGSKVPVEKTLRVTDEFVLEQGDRLLLTSRDTYLRDMEEQFINLVTSLSTKDSVKAFIKELLNRKERENLTALLVYVETLEGFVSQETEETLVGGRFVMEKEENIENRDRKDFSDKEDSSETREAFKEEEDNKDLQEDSERKRIFEQRYRESQMLFNKKVQHRDLDFTPEEKEGIEKDLREEDFEQGSFTPGALSEDFSEISREEHEEEEDEAPWRTRSKFLLVALLGVGVILMAFAFGTIRNLEQRILNPAAENQREEEIEENVGEVTEGEEVDEVEEADEVAEESGEETENGEEVSEEEAQEEEDLQETEAPVNDGEEGEGEPPEPSPAEEPEEQVSNDTYEVQSGDTLFSISRSFYGDASKVEEIISLNNIEDINNIQVGDVLELPPGE
ncbi:LysM peptidoglycan-binding domain-containing protein [Isachenkonia alkalipeptolytica]|uniref:LysM peptidoglycan-binding domain-containing protein n=1 Tax=Isachenkonia alkalipeptolytica TaxID=2565777 RepID=A0AA44BCH9_9CLOT|nr:LysM domain-containing protein [Isachenkonia alkalipeptolytica]NBG86997.1 LysM peptidoglycan-binding domain-containing protein [Isachenkonia alkalipeptolytica]